MLLTNQPIKAARKILPRQEAKISHRHGQDVVISDFLQLAGGLEALILMGLPIDTLSLAGFSDREACLNKLSTLLQVPFNLSY